MTDPNRIRDERLIAEGLRLFGSRGVEGVGTRELARAAGRPMSTITYQFGGKDGLYRACAQHIADTIGALIGTVIESPVADTPAAASEQLSTMFGVMVRAMMLEHTATFASFIMREQQAPSEAFEIIYSGTMGRFLERVVELLLVVEGPSGNPAAARIRAITLMGQVVAFRVANAAVLRLNGWTAIGTAEVAAAEAVIQQNLRAILSALEQGNRG